MSVLRKQYMKEHETKLEKIKAARAVTADKSELAKAKVERAAKKEEEAKETKKYK